MLIVFATCDMPHASDDSELNVKLPVSEGIYEVCVLAPSIPGCPRTATPTRMCD